jgi:hypothetical protein
MNCSTCQDVPDRKDRPHTFLHHAPSSCGSCATPAEARVVVRDGAVFALVFCAQCGQTEAKLADDSNAYLEAFVARGVVPDGAEGDHFFKHTTSTCPVCLRLITANVVIRQAKVYFVKNCPDCGPSEALVSEDADYYVNAYTYARAGTEPLAFRAPVERGCPTDCGTCSDHEQHTCLPIIEVTDHCNLECPICIVNNQNSTHLGVAQFASIVDGLIEAEGLMESVAISGGEPTSHPAFFDLLEAARRDEIGRVVVITNGLRIGRDRAFAERVKESGAYVALQLDGFSARTHEVIRGRDLCADKAAALAVLKELRIPTQLIFVATRHVNEHELGLAVELLLSEDHILSLNLQPAAYTGSGGGTFDHDPMDRLTIPGLIQRIEEQTSGLLKVSDFTPLPCSHPQCVSLTYLLRLDDGSHIPFARFADLKKHGGLLRSSATLAASPDMEATLKDVIYDVYSREDEIPRGADVLRALRRTVDVMFSEPNPDHKAQIRAGEQQAKSIFLHHYMDRHDFDLERLRKCCHHYAQPDGRVMPACGFNMFHRGAAKGKDTPVASWARKPWDSTSQTGASGVSSSASSQSSVGQAVARTRLPLVG